MDISGILVFYMDHFNSLLSRDFKVSFILPVCRKYNIRYLKKAEACGISCFICKQNMTRYDPDKITCK